jgi:diadenosine tetraphosphatase ApaH/serine/threonine PP2A family protein phosphatase
MESQILSKRGCGKFSHDGFVHIFDKVSAKDDNLKLWRCEERGRSKVRIHTFEGEVINSYLRYKCKKLSFIARTGLKYDRGTREYFKRCECNKGTFYTYVLEIFSYLMAETKD